jgi:O-antigen/teichoic acid export membrane protein
VSGGTLSDTDTTVTQRIAGSTVTMMLRRGILMAISAFSTIFIARLLTPSHYGDLQAALATWTLLLALCDFGFTVVLSRDLAAHPDERGRIMRSAWDVQGVWSFLVALFLAVLGILAGADTDRGLMLLVLAPSVLFTGLASGRVLFTVTYNVGLTVKIDVACTVVQVAAMIAVAAAGFGPVAVALVVSIGTIANAVWMGIAARRELPKQARDNSDRFGLVKRVLPLGTMSVLSKVYLSVDLVLLGFYVAGTRLGEYAAAVKVLTLMNTFPGLLVAAAIPGLTTSSADLRQLRDLIGKLLHWLAAAALPLFIFTGVFSRFLLTALLGPEFRGASALLTVLSLAGIVGLLSQVLGVVLVANHIVRPLLFQNVIAVVFNVVLNMALIPHFGAIACAWLTVGTEVIVCGGSWLSIRRTLGIRLPWAVCQRSLVAVGVATIVALLLPVPDLAAAITASAVFVAGTLATRSWPVDLLPQRLRQSRFVVRQSAESAAATS